LFTISAIKAVVTVARNTGSHPEKWNRFHTDSIMGNRGRAMLHIIKYKGCKRCGGDLFLERDSEEVYVSCLQCGAVYIRRVIGTIKTPDVKKRVHIQN
jgi:hypothetical protein